MIRRIILSFVMVLLCCNVFASKPEVIVENRPSLPLPAGGSPLLALFDDDSQKGEIQVSAPKGHPLPYKYLISLQSLPVLDTIWANIKDSIPVDSVDFFQGDVASSFYIFEGLNPEFYHVGVYDNNGVKILDESVLVGPDITLSDSNNIEIIGGVISRGPGSIGNATIDGMITPKANGGLEFQVTEINGDFVFGFNYFGDPTPVNDSQFEYAFEFAPNNTFRVLKGGVTVEAGTVAVNDIFRMYKLDSEMVFCHNEFELARTPISGVENQNLKGAVLFESGLGQVGRGLKIGEFAWHPRPYTTYPIQMECGDLLGRVVAMVSDPYYIGGTGSYILRNAETGTIISTGDISDLLTGIDLSAGEYKIEYNYWKDGLGSAWNAYFSIGYNVYWNLLNPYFTEIDYTVNTIYASESLIEGQALSQNTLNYDEEGWVYFHTYLIRYYPDPDEIFLPLITSNAKVKIVNEDFETKVQVNVVNYGLEILNKYIWVSGEPDDVFTTYSEGPIKIKRTLDPTWKYEVSFENNPIPFTVIDEVEPDPETTFKVMAAGRNCSIYQSYASFCGFENVRSYADLTKKLDGGYYIAQNGIVKFIYHETYNDQDAQLTYKIFDANNEVAVNELDLAQAVVYGDNRYSLDFSTFTGDIVLENGVYILEIKNEKNEKHYLRFKIINN